MARNYIKINKDNEKFSNLMKRLYEKSRITPLNLEGYYKVLNKKIKDLKYKIKKDDKSKYKKNLDNLYRNLSILEENINIQASYLEPDYPKSICSIVYIAEGIEDLEKIVK